MKDRGRGERPAGVETPGIPGLFPNPPVLPRTGCEEQDGAQPQGARPGPAAPRSPPAAGPRLCARQETREGCPGAGVRSRIAVEPHLAHPGGIPVAAFSRPSAFADYSSRHASLNYSSRHALRLYPLSYYTSQHAPRLSGPCHLMSFPRLPRKLHYP